MDPELANMFGLGGPAQAQAPDQAAPAQPMTHSDWSSYLSDPRGRAALISFGLQAMTGGWGNGIQQLGAALGAGAQGAAGQDKIMYDREQAAKEMAQKTSEGAANRAQSETNARIGADSRNEVAQIRSEAMLERARLIRQPQNSQEMKIYSDAANKYRTTEANNQLLSKKTTDQINAEADAWGKSVLDNARQSAGVRSQGQPLPAGAEDLTDAGATSINPAGGTGVPGTPGGAGAPKATSTAPTLDKLINAKGPEADQFRSLIQTPDGQAKLLAIKPDLKPMIDEYNARWAPRQGTALGGAFDALRQRYRDAAQ